MTTNKNAVWIVYDERAISGDTDDAAVLESFGYPDVKDDEHAMRAAKETWQGREYALFRYDVNEKREAQNERLISVNSLIDLDSEGETPHQRRLAILGVLRSTTCACGNQKLTMRSHCRRCYYALTPRMRRSLYQRFGCGYEEAYEESLKFLRQKHAPAESTGLGEVA